eukprot:4209913-Pyramimonas_sp.AAC.1
MGRRMVIRKLGSRSRIGGSGALEFGTCPRCTTPLCIETRLSFEIPGNSYINNHVGIVVTVRDEAVGNLRTRALARSHDFVTPALSLERRRQGRLAKSTNT